MMSNSDRIIWIFMIVVAAILFLSGRVFEAAAGLAIIAIAWWFQKRNSR